MPDMKFQFSLATMLVCMTVSAVFLAACMTIPVSEAQDVVTQREVQGDGQIRTIETTQTHRHVNRPHDGTEVAWRLVIWWPLAFLVCWAWIFRRNIPLGPSALSLFAGFTFLAVACAGVAFAYAEFGDFNPRSLALNFAAMSPFWLPFAFAAYSIGRQRLTWQLVAMFAVAEAQAFVVLHYIQLQDFYS